MGQATLNFIFLGWNLKLRFIASLSWMPSHVPVYSQEKMVHMLVPQPSGDGFVQVNSFILALQAGFTACTKAAGCPGHKAFTRLAFCQPHSARDWCVPWSGFPTQQNRSWKLNSAAAEKSDMVIREQSYAIQDFLCATFIWIDSQVILRENSSVSVGKRKFEREDTEVIRESF